jgi:excisionase family DNA binding protein
MRFRYSAQGFGECERSCLWYCVDRQAVTDKDEFLTADEAAALLKLHPRTVRRMLASGALPGARVGLRQWRVSRQALKDLIEKKTPEPNP